MANLFIAGVGNVELFKGTQSVMVSKTLVDSSINLSVSLEDVRAGQGAKLYGKFAHSSGMTMKLTDAMFRLEFLSANIGATIEGNGSCVKMVNGTVAAGNKITTAEAIAPAPLYDGQAPIIWVAKQGATDFVVCTVEGAEFTAPAGAFEEGDKVCVKYMDNADGDRIKVNANFIPDTLTAVLTATMFAGDDSNLETSTKAGTLTITIPRFMLNGTTDLSMSMTGAAQMALEGSALAVEDNECDGDGYYAIISKVMSDDKWYTNLIKLDFADDSELDDVVIYGIFKNGVRLLTEGVHYTANTEGNTVTVTAIGKETITASKTFA